MKERAISLRADGWVVIEDPDLLPWKAALLVVRVDGVDQVLGLELRPPVDEDGQLQHGLFVRDMVIDEEGKRAIPLARLREAAVKFKRGEFTEAFDWLRRVERTPGQPWPDEHYDLVAEVYRRAVDAGRPPLKDIQEAWGVRRAGAAKWVGRARQLKKLGPPLRGVAGEVDRNEELPAPAENEIPQERTV